MQSLRTRLFERGSLPLYALAHSFLTPLAYARARAPRITHRLSTAVILALPASMATSFVKGTIPTTRTSEKPLPAVPLRDDVLDKLCDTIEDKACSDGSIGNVYIGNDDATVFEAMKLYEELRREMDSIVLDAHVRILAETLRLYLSSQPIALFSVLPVDRCSDLSEAIRMSPAAYHAAMARILKHLKIVCDAQTIPYDVIANSLAPALMGSSMNAARASQLLLDLITGAEQFVHLFPKSLRVFQDPEPLSEDDWRLLLTGSLPKTYDLDEPILEEGQFNYHLFRVKSGSVVVEKGGKVLATLRAGAVLGEMSTLGRYETSASVRSGEFGTVCQLIDCTYIEQLFLVNPELCRKFTWNLVHKLCQRLADLPATREEWLRKQNLCNNATIRVAHKQIVYFKDQTYRSFMCELTQTVRELSNEIAQKMGIKRAGAYNLYAMHDGLKQGVVIEPGELVTAAYSKYKDIPSIKFIFSDRAPKPLKKKLDGSTALKDYSCKLEKRSGHLYLADGDGLWFQHKLLGLVTKTPFPLAQIRSITASGAEIELVLNSEKKTNTYHLTFVDANQASEAVTIANSMLASFNALRSGELGRVASPAAAEPPRHAGDTRSQDAEEHQIRAVVIEEYHAQAKGEITIRLQDLVVVLQKGADGWWTGERGEHVGRFPAHCVKELYEPDLQSSLSEAGYKNVEGVATKEDWLLLLMGGRELKYGAGDIVLTKGQQREAIFQISSGSCRIEVETPDGNRSAVGKMSMDETFGEISLILGHGTTATIVADEPTEVYEIGGEYLCRLFDAYPALAGRFFKYLGASLEQRLRLRESALKGE